VKLVKNSIYIYQTLKQVYGHETIWGAHILMWVKKYQEGRIKMCQKTQHQAKTGNEKVLFRLSRKHFLKTLGNECNHATNSQLSTLSSTF
jgi:hypothetical protein